MKFKLYKKVRDQYHFTGKFRRAPHSICNLHYEVFKEISVKIHNASKYDYRFLIKELAEEFRGEEFEWLGENTEKYISFSVPIEKNIIIILIKQSHTKYSLLTVADYQIILLITCLKLRVKIAKHALKKNLLNQNVNLLGLKIID